MNGKQRRTLKAIFEKPNRSDIAWKDVVTLFEAIGCEISQGSGSRVRVKLNDRRAVFHEPHPDRVICKGAVGSVRKFLLEAGISPE